MSTLKTNTIDTSTGTTITIPTGRVLTVTDNSGISIAGTAVSATAAQLNVMATVTSTAAELNVLDGIPAGLTATELGYSDGVTSAIQTQINTKGTGDASLDTAQNWTKGQRGEITALTDGATITIDMEDSNNFSVTLGGNRTFANPSNDTAGQSGSIFITQDGIGSRTASWGTDWEWAAGTAPVLTTTAAASDRIDYVIRSGTSIQAVATLAYA
jgi:hypothetical protein